MFGSPTSGIDGGHLGLHVRAGDVYVLGRDLCLLLAGFLHGSLNQGALGVVAGRLGCGRGGPGGCRFTGDLLAGGGCLGGEYLRSLLYHPDFTTEYRKGKA